MTRSISPRSHHVPREVEVLVIGASIAGASLALGLARSGLSSVLVDRAKFPRGKACGEGLSVLGIRELERLGLGHLCLALPHLPFQGFRFFDAKRASKLLPGEKFPDFMHGIGVRRYLLDALLVKTYQSLDAGEAWLGEPYAVTRDSKGRFWVRSDYGEVRAKYAVLATGGSLEIPEVLQVPAVLRESSRCGVALDLETEAPREAATVDIFLDGDLQGCATWIEPRRLTLSIMSNGRKSRLLQRKNLASLALRICERLEVNARLIAEPLGVSGIGRLRRSAQHQNIFVVGDALRQLDPIGGMGMTQALLSAQVTAETICALVKGGDLEVRQALGAHSDRLHRCLRRLSAYTDLSYWSLASAVGRPVLGRLKTGRLAQEILLSMHRRPAFTNPVGMLSSLVLSAVGRL